MHNVSSLKKSQSEQRKHKEVEDKRGNEKENYLPNINVKSSGFYSTPNLEEKGSDLV